jgi:hypothetical protein
MRSKATEWLATSCRKETSLNKLQCRIAEGDGSDSRSCVEQGMEVEMNLIRKVLFIKHDEHWE